MICIIRQSLNTSRRQIWMNEQAFSKEAINTIAFRLYIPEKTAEELKAAADKVIDSCEVFHVCLNQEEKGELFFSEDTGFRRYGNMMKKTSLEEIGLYCEEAESRRIAEGSLYEAEIWPVLEGGGLVTFRFHHVLVDGYSMCQIAQRILDVLDGKKLDFDPFSWREESCDLKEEKKFWENYLDGMEGESQLFSGKGRGARRFRKHYTLTEEFSRQIDSYGRKEGVSGASVFAGALALYLARAGQTPESVFLMPRLNRDTPEKREHIGCHTLVIPVRVPVNEEEDFSALCRSAFTQARKGSAHKAYGFGNILRDLKEKGQAQNGISQYTLNIYQPRLSASFPFDVEMSMDGGMHNHLTINITKLKGVYEICYDCREGIYSSESAENFHQAFMEILLQGMGSKDPTGSFSIVGKDEEKRLLHMEGKNIFIDGKDTIPSLFYRAAEAFADCPALYAKNCQHTGTAAYTFQELDRISNRAANALLGKGITGGEPVLFMLNRDERLLPVMLGILKAGAAFVPVDPKYPQKRVDYILKNSKAAFLISSQDVKEAKGREYLEADELLQWPDDSRPQVSISQENLAYCIYTSGTTGTPKGVMLSHRGIVNIVHPENNPFNRDICQRGRGIVAVGSICFDISLFEIFVPLLNGMFIELAPEEALADPEKLAGLLTAHGANLLHCTPSRLSAYRKNLHFSEALRGTEAVLSAGEVLPGSLVTELKKSCGIRIYNGYGPTETTIGATVTEAGDNETIGRPIANTGILILDQKGRLLPEGAAGELCIYGMGVGIGYRGLPEMTAERFVTRYGKRVYRTGDLGYFLPDGRIVYKGRGDHQVKLRGLRIELSEIENRMISFPGVSEACVLVRTLAGSQHLAAFYTVQPGKAVDRKELREYLKEHLAFYMIPDIFKELPQMPQTPGGKTDRKALEKEEISYVRVYRAPENRLQKEICLAFSKVLGEEKVGLDDHFFELGGDSLHIAELAAEIEERVPEVSLEFEEIFKYPTPGLLAEHLEQPAAKQQSEKNLLEELNYQNLDSVLSANSMEGKAEETVCEHDLGNVLLTGVTGFLGIHILMELLKRQEIWNKIYCLVRPTKRLTAEKRLRSVLFYYGEGNWEEFLGSRLTAVEGNIENNEIFAAPFAAHIDTVINCAADVSHFAYDDKLERVNTQGVQHLLDFCRRQRGSFVQISTISISGFSQKTQPPRTLTEQKLYIGQTIRNQYILSKYMAEYELLTAAVKDKIPVKMMRVGNLQGRLSDGEFQMNGRTNGFIRRLSTYVKLGKAPQSVWESSVNISPVDEVARCIVALCTLPEQYTVFHVYPPESVSYSRIFSVLEEAGYPIEILPDGEFQDFLSQVEQTRKGKSVLEGLLLEREEKEMQENSISEIFTEEMLKKLGEHWNPVTDHYLRQYFKILEEYRMFEESI